MLTDRILLYLAVINLLYFCVLVATCVPGVYLAVLLLCRRLKLDAKAQILRDYCGQNSIVAVLILYVDLAVPCCNQLTVLLCTCGHVYACRV